MVVDTVTEQIAFNFKKNKSEEKREPTCSECSNHNRFWICDINGKTMNPCYCARTCAYFKPKKY